MYIIINVSLYWSCPRFFTYELSKIRACTHGGVSYLCFISMSVLLNFARFQTVPILLFEVTSTFYSLSKLVCATLGTQLLSSFLSGVKNYVILKHLCLEAINSGGMFIDCIVGAVVFNCMLLLLYEYLIVFMFPLFKCSNGCRACLHRG